MSIYKNELYKISTDGLKFPDMIVATLLRCYGKHKGKKGNGCRLRTVKEDELFKAIEETIGKAVDEQSVEIIKRVVVTEDDIVVEKN